ncbi:MAG: hypothetical protein ABR518_04950 [Actinomycetota bacterium]
MPIAILLIAVGLLGPVAALMWRRGRWLQSAAWIRRNVSPPAVLAAPLASLLVAFAGLMLIWPPAVVLAFLSAVGVIVVFSQAKRTDIRERAFPELGNMENEEIGDDPSIDRWAS